jgi:hypothetical protein
VTRLPLLPVELLCPSFYIRSITGGSVTACHRRWPGHIEPSIGTGHLDRVHAIEVLGCNSVSVLGHLLDQLWHLHSVVHL